MYSGGSGEDDLGGDLDDPGAVRCGCRGDNAVQCRRWIGAITDGVGDRQAAHPAPAGFEVGLECWGAMIGVVLGVGVEGGRVAGCVEGVGAVEVGSAEGDGAGVADSDVEV